MMSPSPVSIASLSLSPRRQAENVLEADGLSVFDDEEVPDLPSPTRPPRPAESRDPFKAARLQAGRPGLRRQSTVPVHQLASQQIPSFFARKAVAPGAVPSRSTSPTGSRMPAPLSPGRRVGGLTPSTIDGDIHRGILQRNAGRTLVELQQAHVQAQHAVPTVTAVKKDDGATVVKAGPIVAVAPVQKENVPTELEAQARSASRTSSWDERDDVARWDPELVDEMPSPFLARKGRGVMLAAAR